MVTKEQMVAILGFVGAVTVAISAAIALYYNFVEMERLRAELRKK